jgi:uncharacterized membrane protein
VTHPVRQPTRPRDSALLQIVIAAVVGVCVGIASSLLRPAALGPLIGWDAAALTYLIWTWQRTAGLDAAATARHAVRDDPTRTGSDLTLLAASAASLVAVGFVIVLARDSHGAARGMQAALGTVSVVVSWLVVHSTYMLRYATLYHLGSGGIDFNQDAPPRYSDFAYLAFTIGMTFQVSDTPLSSSAIRRTALNHALLSYLYGTVIIATAINLVAGLSG